MRSNQFFSGRFNRWAAVLILAAAGLISGCGEPVPDVVPLSVSVKTRDGKPLNSVQVRFVPMLESLDGNFIATGITDANGECEIVLPGKSESSITVGSHKVQLLETGGSAEARAAYMAGDPSVALREKNNLKNRPIPQIYERLSATPLLYDISPDQGRIDIVLE